MTKMDSKKKKKRNKRLFLAILMILFTGVILTASTFAWFTANQTVKIEQIDVTVATSDGLQISADASTWKPTLTTADITGASWSGVTNQLPSASHNIVPVSTVGTISNGFMQMWKGEVKTGDEIGLDTDEYRLIAAQSTESNRTDGGDFIAFDVFFQVNSAGTLYLTSNSSVTGDLKGIEYATRVAFLNEGHVDAGSTAATAQALTGASTAIIWEPNYDVHTSTGVSNALNVYGVTTTETGGSQLPYYGVKAAISNANAQALNSNNSTYFSSVTPTFATTADGGIPSSAYQQLISLSAGITKVRIYMWVEGQDVDCENNASGGAISLNLQFSLLANGSSSSS